MSKEVESWFRDGQWHADMRCGAVLHAATLASLRMSILDHSCPVCVKPPVFTESDKVFLGLLGICEGD